MRGGNWRNEPSLNLQYGASQWRAPCPNWVKRYRIGLSAHVRFTPGSYRTADIRVGRMVPQTDSRTGRQLLQLYSMISSAKLPFAAGQQLSLNLFLARRYRSRSLHVSTPSAELK